MTSPHEHPIGRRVAYWRVRRRMSQQVFADRLGKSKSWVDKIERGVRRLDKFSVLHEIADVLQIDVHLLLGKAPARNPAARPAPTWARSTRSAPPWSATTRSTPQPGPSRRT